MAFLIEIFKQCHQTFHTWEIGIEQFSSMWREVLKGTPIPWPSDYILKEIYVKNVIRDEMKYIYIYLPLFSGKKLQKITVDQK